MTYKLIKDSEGKLACIARSDGAGIPFDPANTDYAQFKIDIAKGKELLDADGNTMTAEQVAEFLKTLP